MALKEKSLIDDYCDGKSQILKFFSDVCIIDQKSDDEIRSCFDKDESNNYIFFFFNLYFY